MIGILFLIRFNQLKYKYRAFCGPEILFAEHQALQASGDGTTLRKALPGLGDPQKTRMLPPSVQRPCRFSVLQRRLARAGTGQAAAPADPGVRA
jgi:hypothetical protein